MFYSYLSVSASPKSEREHFSIRLPDTDKQLSELTKSELEEIAHVIRHHEKKNYNNGRYYFNDVEIYPKGPLNAYMDDESSNGAEKFTIEDLNENELCLKPSNKKRVESDKTAAPCDTKSEDPSLVKRVKVINMPKRTLTSNQHFIVDIDNEAVLASDLGKADLDKLVAIIDKHRPEIRTKTSRYFLNGMEILPRGILRPYFSEYELADEPPTALTQVKEVGRAILPPAPPATPPPPPIVAPLRVKIESVPVANTGEASHRDYCVYLLEDGDKKRAISDLNESELTRIVCAISKHWPEHRTKASRFFFHGVDLFPSERAKEPRHLTTSVETKTPVNLKQQQQRVASPASCEVCAESVVKSPQKQMCENMQLGNVILSTRRDSPIQSSPSEFTVNFYKTRRS